MKMTGNGSAKLSSCHLPFHVIVHIDGTISHYLACILYFYFFLTHDTWFDRNSLSFLSSTKVRERAGVWKFGSSVKRRNKKKSEWWERSKIKMKKNSSYDVANFTFNETYVHENVKYTDRILFRVIVDWIHVISKMDNRLEQRDSFFMHRLECVVRYS
jgi:hypothetical protein